MGKGIKSRTIKQTVIDLAVVAKSHACVSATDLFAVLSSSAAFITSRVTNRVPCTVSDANRTMADESLRHQDASVA